MDNGQRGAEGGMEEGLSEALGCSASRAEELLVACAGDAARATELFFAQQQDDNATATASALSAVVASPAIVPAAADRDRSPRLDATRSTSAAATTPRLYTIGHGSHSIDAFVALLRQHAVACVVDVRLQPFSKASPQFVRRELERWLPENGIECARNVVIVVARARLSLPERARALPLSGRTASI